VAGKDQITSALPVKSLYELIRVCTQSGIDAGRGGDDNLFTRSERNGLYLPRVVPFS